jgi:SPP1 gp7 family putative phage head morphogenesis protein
VAGPEELPAAGLLPEEAIAFFRAKGFAIGFNWQDIFKQEHVRDFTVAKAMTRDLLEDFRSAVDKALAEGTTLATFRKELQPTLEAKGWWGKKVMLDPATGQHEVVQLGSPRRLKTIFDTNVRTAYQAGKWERVQRSKKAFPFLEYSAVMDGRERPEHGAWDGIILPVDHPWWDTHYGPCDWNCRCTAVARSQRMLDREGKTVSAVPPANDMLSWTNTRTGETGELEAGIGKGWDYNVGKEYLRGLAPTPLPESFDGEEIDAAELSGAQRALIDRFLAAFGVEPGGEAIWMDRDGWPLSIGRGWFIGADRRVRLPTGAAGVVMARIAAAIVEGDASWVWVRGADGRALLMRRYTRTAKGATTLVDVGRDGWRWLSGRAEEIAAAHNPRQPRDKNGRWSRSGAMQGLLSQALSDPGFVGVEHLAPAGANAPDHLQGFAREVHAHSLRKSWQKHGVGGTGKDKHPLTAADFDKIPLIASKGVPTVHGVKRGGQGQSVSWRLDIGGVTHVYVEIVGTKRGNRLTSKTFYKED